MSKPPHPRRFTFTYTPPGWDLYCSPCRIYGPTYRSPQHIPLEEVMQQAGEEVIQITSSGGYVNFEFLKITAPIVFNQRFEPENLGSERQCFSTAPSWDLYVESGDNVVKTIGRANEIGQSWGPADLLDFQFPTTGTSHRPTKDPLQTHVA